MQVQPLSNIFKINSVDSTSVKLKTFNVPILVHKQLRVQITPLKVFEVLHCDKVAATEI